MAAFSRCISHQDERKCSETILEKAREKAQKEKKYDSLAVRNKITEVFRQRTGKSPYGWQVQVAEALLLGLDCTVIAGTGMGKTMPFVMPTFVENKIMVIISPLNALENDQVRIPTRNWVFRY